MPSVSSPPRIMSKETTQRAPPKFPWPEPNGNVKQYDMHCHCGAIRWTVKLSPPLYAEQTTSDHPERYTLTECHCSYCIRNGYWATHPFVKDVEWKQGLEHRGHYRTAGKLNPYWVCTTCHCVLGSDLTEKMRNRFGLQGDEERTSINVGYVLGRRIGANATNMASDAHAEGLRPGEAGRQTINDDERCWAEV